MAGARRIDWEWDRGGDWERIVERRTYSRVVLPVVAPTVLELRPPGVRSTVAPTLTVPAHIEDDGTASLRVTAEQMEPLTLDRYQHRVIVTDQATHGPIVLLRGWVTLLDMTGDT